MEEREPLDLTKLPYAYDPMHYHVVPEHDLHMMMCDLAIKLPKLKFVALGRVYRNDTYRVDDVRVFNDDEKVGRLWVGRESIDGKIHTVYQVESDRIQNKRGKRNRKHSRIYKKALDIALFSFAPIENKKIADEIIETAKYRVTGVAQNAASQLQYAVRGNERAILEYFKVVEDVGPTEVPPELLKSMKEWRDKLTNSQVASSVRNAMDACTGVFIKLSPSEVMTLVDLTTTSVATRFTSSYDLPLEYQEKFAILKMMDVNQPITGVGIKVEDGQDTFFYLTTGAMQTTC